MQIRPLGEIKLVRDWQNVSSRSYSYSVSWSHLAFCLSVDNMYLQNQWKWRQGCHVKCLALPFQANGGFVLCILTNFYRKVTYISLVSNSDLYVTMGSIPIWTFYSFKHYFREIFQSKSLAYLCVCVWSMYKLFSELRQSAFPSQLCVWSNHALITTHPLLWQLCDVTMLCAAGAMSRRQGPDGFPALIEHLYSGSDTY